MIFRHIKVATLAVALSFSLANAQSVTNDADGLFDSTSYVETDSTTNNTTTSTVTTDNTNTNTSTITSDNTNTNTNTNTSTITSTNTNNNTNTNTSTNTNTNTNTNTSTVDQTVNQTTSSTINQTVNTTSNITTNNTNTSTSTNTNNNTNNTTVDSTANNTNTNNNTSDITQKVESPPASAIAPSIQSGGNDTCTVSYSAAVQTQIIGMSGGGHVRDLNCERLKNAKALYNMGMKVAAVSLMCQEESIFKAMEMAGTPCPFRGEIGSTAQALWDNDPENKPQPQKEQPNDTQNFVVIGSILLLLLTGI